MKYLSTLRNRDSVRGGELDRLSQANMGSSFVATCRWNNAFTHPDGEHRTVGFAHPELVHAVMQKGVSLPIFVPHDEVPSSSSNTKNPFYLVNAQFGRDIRDS